MTSLDDRDVEASEASSKEPASSSSQTPQSAAVVLELEPKASLKPTDTLVIPSTADKETHDTESRTVLDQISHFDSDDDENELSSSPVEMLPSTLVIPSRPWRVKVYELRHEHWADLGTGYCSPLIDTRSSNDADDANTLKDQVNEKQYSFVVRAEDPPGDIQNMPENEKNEKPEFILLQVKITEALAFHRQHETLIVWTDLDHNTDLSLSFQDSEGCIEIWDYIRDVKRLVFKQLNWEKYMMTSIDDMLGYASDSINQNSSILHEPLQLPDPKLSNLDEIVCLVRDASLTQNGRDGLVKFIINENYFKSLNNLFEDCEDLEDIASLHLLCGLIKQILTTNDAALFEYITADDIIMGIVGILEYDPGFPTHKATYRQFLKDKNRFKQVVEIKNNEIRSKIHRTYRLQYLKDVILARFIDDTTLTIMASLIYFNQIDILQKLRENEQFLDDLFDIFRKKNSTEEEKIEAVQFVQQFCATAKFHPAQWRNGCYLNFIRKGLFNMIEYALESKNATVRGASLEILVSVIEHDPSLARKYIMPSSTAKEQQPRTLLTLMIRLLKTEPSVGFTYQVAEALRMLVDPYANPQSDPLQKESERDKLQSSSEKFLQFFYDHHAKDLIKPLDEIADDVKAPRLTPHRATLYTILCSLLSFFVKFHTFRSKYLMLSENSLTKIAFLFKCNEKHVNLAALRFLRTCVSLNDEFYNRTIIRHDILAPLLERFFADGDAQGLFNSAVLELFEFIRIENIKNLIKFLVENFRNQMEQIKYTDVFKGLLVRYEQNHAPPPSTTSDQDAKFDEDSKSETSKWPNKKDSEKMEDEYFGTSDEDTSPGLKSKRRIRGLVDYKDDDEENTDQNETMTKEQSNLTREQPPVEGVREKRLREEAEAESEEGLIKLRKRKGNPQEIRANGKNGSEANAKSDKSSNNSLRKISINLSTKMKSLSKSSGK